MLRNKSVYGYAKQCYIFNATINYSVFELSMDSLSDLDSK